MNHKAALALIPDDVSSALTERENRAGLIHLAGHFALICVMGALVAARIPFWGFILPLHGIALVFLFTLEHETTHQTPFAHTGLNDWIGRLCGVVILLPFEWFRYFHLAHHRHTNDPDHDPELTSGAKPDTWKAYLIYVSGFGYWSSMTRQLWLNATGQANAPYLPARTIPRIKREARIMIALYAFALLSLLITPVLLWVWVVPVLLGQPALRLYLLAEHGRCAFVANMLENTRTTYTNRFMRFIAWNMPYHAEHHAAPQVPFHKLPQLNTYLKDKLQVTSNSYTEFIHETMSQLPR
ncbi:fatty acid desaturase [Litoreibacter sp.]|nr:fatty acid desaturase [Litoreibacter sp.]